MTKLNAMQNKFIDLYLANLNEKTKLSNTQLAINAGYAEPSAAQQASRMYNSDKIQEAIQARFTEYTMSRNEALHHITEIARGVKDGADINQQIKCLELMAKYHNLTNRTEVTGKDGDAIVFELKYPDKE